MMFRQFLCRHRNSHLLQPFYTSKRFCQAFSDESFDEDIFDDAFDPNKEVNYFVITAGIDRPRLYDVVKVAFGKGIPSEVQSLIEEKKLMLNGKLATKRQLAVKEEDYIDLFKGTNQKLGGYIVTRAVIKKIFENELEDDLDESEPVDEEEEEYDDEEARLKVFLRIYKGLHIM